MSGIVLTATRDVALTPEAVFETLGSWLFGASFERLEVGRPLTLTVPFGGAASGFTIFGRIRRIVWGVGGHGKMPSDGHVVARWRS